MKLLLSIVYCLIAFTLIAASILLIKYAAKYITCGLNKFSGALNKITPDAGMTCRQVSYIDAYTKVALLQYHNKTYIVLLSSKGNNLILDKYSEQDV